MSKPHERSEGRCRAGVVGKWAGPKPHQPERRPIAAKVLQTTRGADALGNPTRFPLCHGEDHAQFSPDRSAGTARVGWVMRIFPTIAEREEAPVLIMIMRRNAFTVLGLRFIRLAITLLLMPCSKYSNTSRSRCVSLNCWQICDNGTSPAGPLSSRIAMLG